MLYMKAKSLNKVTKESAMRNAQESADTNLLWAPVKPVVLLHPSTHGNAAVSHATVCLHHSVYTEYNQLPTKHKSLEITSRYSTGSQKLHHSCPLANKVDNTWVQRSLGNPQSATSCWGRSGPTQYMVYSAPECISQMPSWQFHPFSQGSPHTHGEQTHRQTGMPCYMRKQ